MILSGAALLVLFAFVTICGACWRKSCGTGTLRSRALPPITRIAPCTLLVRALGGR
ncbi:hypothetical protein SAMN05444581_1235 [Methylocapsa palsarum]|uniref:Uncharacterized protein n=1 Tax=Methylocapsa palsarum TaxID=1612308 RepID=A0A1I4CHV8_9HYPH|nr:hypothetical protein SAMN05444581_1235 [Methylocapsa palsarum]